MKASELAQAMADAGAPMEAILIALRAVEERDEAIEARRAGDRERKRRQRATTPEPGGTVTGQSRDIPGNVTPEAPLSLPPNDNNSNPPTHTPGNKPRARKGPGRPADVGLQVWEDFTNHRNRLKAPVSETALDGIRREAAKAGLTLNDALAECVSQGWRGFRADWVTKNQTAAPIRSSNDAGSMTALILARKQAAGP